MGKKKTKQGGVPRIFEFKDGKSDKFWEVSLDGNSHTVRYGRVGTDGQTKTKEFGDKEKAEASYQKLIGQKVKKGYVEVKQSEARSVNAIKAKSSLKEHAPFLDEIHNSPDEYGPYGVYADWLTERGDPRGEFIQLQWQLEDPKCKGPARKKIAATEKRLLKKHESEWLGDLQNEVERDVLRAQKLAERIEKGEQYYGFEGKCFESKFARGFVDSIKINFLWPEFATLLTKSKSLSLVRRLHIEYLPNSYDLEDSPEYEGKVWNDENPVAKVFSKVKFPNLRELRIQEDYPCHLRTPGIHQVVKNAPRLETLHLESHDVSAKLLFKTKMPNLKYLAVFHIHEHPMSLLGKNDSLTSLETLALCPHAVEYDAEPYIRLPELKAITRSKYLKNLKSLTLSGTDFGDPGIEELIESGMLMQLENLNLNYGAVTDVGAERLIDLKDFGNLKNLDLSGNYISAKVAKLLKKLNPKIKVSEQLTGDPNDEKEHLFYGDIE